MIFGMFISTLIARLTEKPAQAPSAQERARQTTTDDAA
jgi:hypothetical protein